MSFIERWLIENTAHIEQVLSDYATAHLYHGRRHRRAFPLSDLGLCGAIGSGRILFPKQYSVESVFVSTTTNPHKISHYIGFDGQNILDIVAGQFLRDDVNMVSGVAIMLEKSPQLLYVLSNELVVLHANAQAIESQLDIKYLTS
jgi:hypothetical protein